MKQTPKGWPRLSSALFYDKPADAIDWLCKAFGFQVRLKVEGENGSIVHSELEYGEAVVMVADASGKHKGASPRTLDGVNTQSLMLFVDDVEAHCAHARAAGAKIRVEPKVSDYGEEYWSDRSYEVEDLEGHRWWFCERLRG